MSKFLIVVPFALVAVLLTGCAGSVKTSERPCDPNCYSQRSISSIRM